MTLTLKIANKLFCLKLWLMTMHHNTKFGNKIFVGLEDIIWTVTFWPTLWPWPWLQNQNFHRTLWLMMLHHHTKFGNKMFCSSEDIIRTNIHWHFESLLWHWPWMQLSNFVHRTLRFMMQYYHTNFGCKWNSSLEDIVEIVIFCLFKPSLWLWHWR